MIVLSYTHFYINCEGKTVDVVYLDLVKAFDIVAHNDSLETLALCGLDRCIFHWVESELPFLQAKLHKLLQPLWG